MAVKILKICWFLVCLLALVFSFLRTNIIQMLMCTTGKTLGKSNIHVWRCSVLCKVKRKSSKFIIKARLLRKLCSLKTFDQSSIKIDKNFLTRFKKITDPSVKTNIKRTVKTAIKRCQYFWNKVRKNRYNN